MLPGSLVRALLPSGLAALALGSCKAESAIAVRDPLPCTGASCDGGPGGSGGAPAAEGGREAGPIEPYTLVVDAPSSGATVSGVVTVSGRAPGFVNVEVWDPEHQHPPLARTVPDSVTGAFRTTVDTAGLASGPAIWTVYGWDSPPNESYEHEDTVELALTIESEDGSSGGQTIGTGDVAEPAIGPPPVDAETVGGAPFVLVKNWDFGTMGTITGTGSLASEFLFHDQFGTIGNGTKYGAVTVAATAETALPDQPVEDPARPTREWTSEVMRAHVQPLSAAQTTVSAGAHDAGNGSVMAKWKLPRGGVLLGRDVLWETRVRMPVTLPGYWFALWTSGNRWDEGAEVDVLESFGTPDIYPPPTAFFSGVRGGTTTIDYASWPDGLDTAGIPEGGRDLREWHVFTWIYGKDDAYAVYFDGRLLQSGSIHWTLGGAPDGEPLDLDFLFDFGWGHTVVEAVNITLPASDFPVTYEIDYSRVYLR